MNSIFEAVVLAFIPEDLSPSALSLICRALKAHDVSEFNRVIDSVGLARFSEQKYWLLRDLLYLDSSFHYAVSGLLILDEFPAQRLFQVRSNIKEKVDWKTFWPACGGRFYNGEMIALKWDPVWVKISVFSFPVPPFQIPSGYDVEDVDRDEAESLGLIQPRDRAPTMRFEIDLAELKSRIAAELHRAGSTDPGRL